MGIDFVEFPGPSRVALALGISLVAKYRALALNSDQVNRLRGRAVQQTSQLESVWDVLFWKECLVMAIITTIDRCCLPSQVPIKSAGDSN